MWHRFLRQVAFWAGFATCAVIVAVIYFNPATVTLNFWRWELTGVNLGMVAVVPLVIGVALGYLYHLPARLHHVSEHMRHRRRVHELERELKDLRTGMDQVLEMPDDAHALPALEARPVPALEAPRNGDRDEPPANIEPAIELPDEPPAEERVEDAAQKPGGQDAKPKAAARKPRSSNGKARRPRTPSVSAELTPAAPAAVVEPPPA